MRILCSNARDLCGSDNLWTYVLAFWHSRCQESRKRVANDRLRILSRVYYIFSMAHTIGNKKKLINRVRRIRGQIDAVEKAIQARTGIAESTPAYRGCPAARLTASWPRSSKAIFVFTSSILRSGSGTGRRAALVSGADFTAPWSYDF